jgi:LSD1 subclass zinc finger protein
MPDPSTDIAVTGHSTFPCSSCGAELEFVPGPSALKCPHCGTLNDIAPTDEQIQELDYAAALDSLKDHADTIDAITVHCDSCGATISFDPGVTSQSCPFCGSNVVAARQSTRLLKPKSLLPFELTADQSQQRFARWLKDLWFAPNDLKKIASVESIALGKAVNSASRGTQLTGIYLPFWTFDARTTTPYTGQRGDDYYVTVGSGKNTRTERRTRWSYRNGIVHNAFDDVLTPGSLTLPPKLLDRLGNWDTKALVPYDDRYLSGFRAESYAIDLPAAFTSAKEAMLETVRITIRRDIGGDHQRITSMSPQFSGITFKHILLPIWVSTFRYKGKLYRFLVNARTGQISGERPYSAWKITLAVLLALAIAGLIAFFASQR